MSTKLRTWLWRLLLALPFCAAGPGNAEVIYDWVTVGDPGNVADDTGFGAVAEEFRIGRFEVTNSQYAEFLNSVAADDPNKLYIGEMSFWPGAGILRDGAPGSYRYSPIAGSERKPAVYVTLWSAMRFANWMHNGQPDGRQDVNTTEDGAYTITAEGIAQTAIARNPDASIFIPSEDQWYKAAYYKSGGVDAGYWDYATGSDEVPASTDPPGGTNAANYDRGFNFTSVGSYSSSASPYGTFDQAGNAWEWTEGVSAIDTVIIRGGSAPRDAQQLSANLRKTHTPHRGLIGFRLASLTIDSALGDFDGNGILDLADIDMLLWEVAAASQNPSFDVTSDGRVNDADIFFWIKDLRKTWIGDADLNGLFNSSDLVAVLNASTYERDVDAGWSQGDWTGDRRFSTADFVAALEGGGYEQGAVRAVPEPTGGLLLLSLGTAVLLTYRRRL